MKINYEDRQGKEFQSKQSVYVHVNDDRLINENIGIRKTILLVNYATLLKKWIKGE